MAWPIALHGITKLATHALAQLRIWKFELHKVLQHLRNPARIGACAACFVVLGFCCLRPGLHLTAAVSQIIPLAGQLSCLATSRRIHPDKMHCSRVSFWISYPEVMGQKSQENLSLVFMFANQWTRYIVEGKLSHDVYNQTAMTHTSDLLGQNLTQWTGHFNLFTSAGHCLVLTARALCVAGSCLWSQCFFTFV